MHILFKNMMVAKFVALLISGYDEAFIRTL
jgi:hypothetical protein